MKKIRVGLLGYGNIAKGVEANIPNFADIEVFAVFTRRSPKDIGAKIPAYNIAEMERFAEKIDVLILCGGSARDIPQLGPLALRHFNTVDCFDTHAKIPLHFSRMDETGKKYGKLGLVSAGWDPGLFSLSRLLFGAFLPRGSNYTFWGRGVSQGHSDAVRKIDGVVDARQYTVPCARALELVRGGLNPQLSSGQKHSRVCYVVAREGADLTRIEKEIVTMPDYFAGYDTTVFFISAETLEKEHSRMPHGGFVLTCGETAAGISHIMEFSLKLESNPQFTAAVLLASARAAAKMFAEGRTGAITMMDVPPAYYSDKRTGELFGLL